MSERNNVRAYLSCRKQETELLFEAKVPEKANGESMHMAGTCANFEEVMSAIRNQLHEMTALISVDAGHAVIEATLKQIGSQIFSHLMPAGIRDAIQSSPASELLVAEEGLFVPFELTFDGKEFWGMRYAIATFLAPPGSRILGIQLDRQLDQIATVATPKIAVLADTRGRPGAKEEVQDIAEKFSDTRLLLGLPDTKAAKSEILESLKDYSIIHYVGHGTYVGDEPEKSFLYLGDERISAGDFLQADLSGVKLVVLSACATGISSPKEETGMTGMAEALLRAGASSVIGTQWSITDYEAAAFAAAFYSALFTRNVDVAEALRQARLSVTSAGDITSALSYTLLLLPSIESKLA